MTRLLVFLVGVAAWGAEVSTRPTVTFDKDALPILQKNCQNCHRPVKPC